MGIQICRIVLSGEEQSAISQQAALNAANIGLDADEWAAEVARRGASAEMMMAHDPEGEAIQIERQAARENAWLA